MEVLKYSYCGKIIESEETLSEKVCLRIISFRKTNTDWFRFGKCPLPAQSISVGSRKQLNSNCLKMYQLI